MEKGSIKNFEVWRRIAPSIRIIAMSEVEGVSFHKVPGEREKSFYYMKNTRNSFLEWIARERCDQASRQGRRGIDCTRRAANMKSGGSIIFCFFAFNFRTSSAHEFWVWD